MKTMEEVEALTGWVAAFEASFDGSDEDEIAQGFVQAHQDVAFENEAMDPFLVAQVRRWSPAYAEGYRAGVREARATLTRMQRRKGAKSYPRDRGFNAMAVHSGR